MIRLLLVLTLSVTALGESERWYQEQTCTGVVEHRLVDKTRVDCLTETHAQEYDFARKWGESIGQSLHYSVITGKKAGIVLIKLSDKDDKYIERVARIIQSKCLDIDLWTVNTKLQLIKVDI